MPTRRVDVDAERPAWELLDAASGGGGDGSKIIRNADIRSTTVTIVSVRIMLSSWEPPIGIEPMTYALRGACARPACALAAPIAPVIALTALAALGLPDDPVHEPVHARGLCVLSSCAVRDLAEDAVSADASGHGPCRVISRRFYRPLSYRL